MGWARFAAAWGGVARASLRRLGWLALVASCGDESVEQPDAPGSGACTSDGDCAYLAHHSTTASCRAGVCTVDCDEPLVTCLEPLVCVTGLCVDPGPCDDGYDCASGEACDGSSCAVVPDVPSCAAPPSLLLLAELDQDADILAFRDADGDGARELVMAGSAGVWQLAAGQPSSEVLIPDGRSYISDLAVADLDGDGLEDVVVAGEGLRTITATGLAVPIDDKLYHDIELCDLPPHDGVVEGLGLAQGMRLTSLSNDGTGSLFGDASAESLTEDLALAGASLDGHRRVIIAWPEAVFTWRFSAGSSGWHYDRGVLGRAVAGGDLVAGASDELLRLSPGDPWTIATQWSLTGERLVPGARGRLTGRLDLVQLGDVDGDGAVDAVLAGAGVVLWRAPGLPSSPTTGCVSKLEIDTPRAVAVGDHDGDGRAEVAIATKAGVQIWGLMP